MLLVAAVALLLAASPGGAPSPGLWETNGPAYPAIDLIVAAPDDENVVYAGAHDPGAGKSALFRSRDGGTSWETVAEAPAGETLTRFAIDPTGPERMLALTKAADGHGQMYRSDDGGESWRMESVAFQPDGAEIFFEPGFANTGFLFSGRRLQRSDDAGPWMSIEFLFPMESAWISPGAGLFWLAFVQATPNPRYPNLFPPPGWPPPSYWEIFTSTTQGRRSSFVAYADCSDLESVVFAPSDHEVAYAISTTCAPLAKSIDGGANWTYVASHDLTNLLASLRGQVAKIAVDPTDSSGLFVTLLSRSEPSGLLLHSDNGGCSSPPSLRCC